MIKIKEAPDSKCNGNVSKIRVCPIATDCERYMSEDEPVQVYIPPVYNSHRNYCKNFIKRLFRNEKTNT